MKTLTKILKIKDNKFYYTEQNFIEIKNTNIPYNELKFKSHLDIYWEVELSNYNIDNKTVKIRVLDYYPKNISKYHEQEHKNPIEFFQFEKLEWIKIEPQLSNYKKIALTEIMEGIDSDDNKYDENNEIEERVNQSNINFNERPIFFNKKDVIEQVEYQTFTINEEFSSNYENAKFNDGFVSVDYKPKLCSKEEEIRIFNNLIISNFDYIKKFFTNYFNNNNKFNVQLSGKVQLGKLISYKATSEEIQSINEDVISDIGSAIEVKLIKTINPKNVDKNIYSLEELEELIESPDLSRAIKDFFIKEPQIFLDTIIEKECVRNKKQLEYFAGFKQREIYQLRFTLKPLFGFLFYIESGNRNHFCWELLNSHATYIWSFDSKYSYSEKINDIESFINKVKINGRKKYKELVKAENSKDVSFSTLYHKTKSTKYKNGFDDWKNRLEKIIKNSIE